MTPESLKEARRELGLSAAKLAELLRLGADGGRAVRRWEAGERAISGPVAVAIELLLERQRAASAAIPPPAMTEC